MALNFAQHLVTITAMESLDRGFEHNVSAVGTVAIPSAFRR